MVGVVREMASDRYFLSFEYVRLVEPAMFVAMVTICLRRIAETIKEEKK